MIRWHTRFRLCDPWDLAILSVHSAAPLVCLLAGGMLTDTSEVHMNGTTDFVNNSADEDGGEERHHAATGVDVCVVVRARAGMSTNTGIR